MAIHSSGQIIFSLTHIEGTTVGAGKEVDEVAGRANDIGLDGIDQISKRANQV